MNVMINSTTVEADAITNLRIYLKKCPNIKYALSENDKGICWDGHLDLYRDGIIDKDHYVNHANVQIKGKMVNFLTEECKFPIEKKDLEVYKTESTIFIVCQMEKESSNFQLFYRNLLPETIKNLLRGKDKQSTISTVLKKFPEKGSDFEDIVSVFITDRTKQSIGTSKHSITMEEATQRGITTFQMSTPAREMTQLEKLCYLSKMPSFLYAQVNKEFNLTVPVDGGPMLLKFKHKNSDYAYIKEKKYPMQVATIVENGEIMLQIGTVLQLCLTNVLDDYNAIPCHAHSEADYLDERLEEMEFLAALETEKNFTISGYTFELNDSSNTKSVIQYYENLLHLKDLLNRLHVYKRMKMTNLTEYQDMTLHLLYDTIVLKNAVKLTNAIEGVRLLPIGDIKLLIWIYKKGDGSYVIGDVFGEDIKILNHIGQGPEIEMSPYSYLTMQNLWAEVDNIDYSQILLWAQKMYAEDKNALFMINEDVLAMINAADEVKESDKTKRDKLLSEALSVTEWLLSIHKEEHLVYELNQLQIYQRQDGLTEEHVQRLWKIARNKKSSTQIVIGAYLLLGEKKRFNHACKKLTSKDLNQLKKYPIWKYANDLITTE